MSAKAAAAKFSAATSFPLAVPAQRALLCACVTALTWACTSGSLFIMLPELQRALVVGVAAGLIGELWVAVASAGLVALVGAALGPASCGPPRTRSTRAPSPGRCSRQVSPQV